MGIQRYGVYSAAWTAACIAGVFTSCIAWQSAYGQSSDDSANVWDYFQVNLPKAQVAVDLASVVSDPPILRAKTFDVGGSHVVVPSGCEAYLKRSSGGTSVHIVGRKPKDQPIEGKLYLVRKHPKLAHKHVLSAYPFSVAAQPTSLPDRKEFFLTKGKHFERLWSSEFAGTAIFRNLASDSMQRVGKTAKPVGPRTPLTARRSADTSIEMMAGGRAVSENLALNNPLDEPKNYLGVMQDLSNVAGITINKINWQNRLSKAPTKLDPLAKLVPHDQYAVFVPSFDLLANMIERGNELARPLVHWFEPQSRATDVLTFYQTQLGLPINALTKQVGRAMIGEVAITGSDPYFRTGTDLAVLMQTDQPDLLLQAIKTQVAAQSATHRGVRQIEHKLGSHVFTQWTNQARRFSSYVAKTDRAVIVSNSMHQMTQVLRTLDRDVQSMHSLDEYKFFRQRYKRQQDEPAALVVITDDAIRRWCGPKWRISASRRTRARAVIADATVKHLDELVQGTVDHDQVFFVDSPIPGLEAMILTPTGVLNQKFGTLNFQTPIAEMNLTHATTQETRLYSDWRNRYERKWRRVFDPIAIQLKFTENQIHADLSVIPLVVQSQYRQLIQMVGKARLKPGAGDPHAGSLASFDIAIDTSSPMFAFARAFLQSQVPGDFDPFGWISGSASLYFDLDEEWLKQIESVEPWQLEVRDMARNIPIGLHVPSQDSLRLTAFMVAARSLINSFAPNTILWESRKHKGFDFIVAKPTGENRRDEQMAYVTLPDGITLSANINVIKRSIERFIERKKAKDAAKDQRQLANQDDPVEKAVEESETPKLPADPSRILAPQLQMEVTGRGLIAMTQANYDNGLRRTQRIAWSNLPILNYLRQRFPDKDPAKIYQTVFGQKLVEPSGGDYIWNENRSTYASTNHGYQLEPQMGQMLDASFSPGDRIQTTVSFQDGGLRATLSVTRAVKQAAGEQKAE